ncbi:MAG TPA: hypothetical protein PLX15_05325 [Candidatus Woesearchaeota archaeon]|jgi:hypothetical protein|nr:hypothetical protein [Candidatus Woesearchaeota archaeon]
MDFKRIYMDSKPLLQKKNIFECDTEIADKLRRLKRKIPKMNREDWLITLIKQIEEFYSKAFNMDYKFTLNEVNEKIKEIPFSKEILEKVLVYNQLLTDIQYSPKDFSNTSSHELIDQFKEVMDILKTDYDRILEEEFKKNNPLSTKKKSIFPFELFKKKEDVISTKIRQLLIVAYSHLEKDDLVSAANIYNEIVSLYNKINDTKDQRIKREIVELYERLSES